MVTTREIVGQGIERLRSAGVDTPRLDAELLFALVAGVDRTGILAHPDALVGDGQIEAFKAAVGRRVDGEPVAYIRGMKEFHGVALTVDRRALIPRPETEHLVDAAVAEAMRRLTVDPRTRPAARVRIVDVGTGSGAIAIALAVALRARRVPPDEVTIVATDTAAEALELARENAVGHGLGDWLSFVGADLLPGREGSVWDLVLANLPYVRSGDMAGLPRPTAFEPPAALDGGPDGLAIIGRLLDRLPAGLAPGGIALLEIGADQGQPMSTLLAERLPGWDGRIETDLAGLPRLTVVERPSA
ncbi:MAG: peptide chain release factor N(5)-glutamine methyltransferase [Candidatus Limnocylindrales bacterium]